MEVRNNRLSLEDVKNRDMVEYLSGLGFIPSKISRNDHWYLSPFRNETTPSFKVNRNLNRWYDFGEGEGGNLIDFGLTYFKCSVSDLLKKMSDSFFFQQTKIYIPHEGDVLKKIEVIKAKDISSPALLRYLQNRRIPLGIARHFCKEVVYSLYGKNYYAIGFPNNAGGYELRNEKCKISSSPKDVSFIDNNSEKLTVFEGFFNFLSYQAIHQNQQQPIPSFLVLNSASFFNKSLPLMQAHKAVHLYLDCDTTGQKCIDKALEIDKEKFVDERRLYDKYNDLNDWMMHIVKSDKQRMHLR